MKKQKSRFEMIQWIKSQEAKKLARRSKADHRHNYKNARKVRIYGSLHHVYCTVKGCDHFKVVGG